MASRCLSTVRYNGPMLLEMASFTVRRSGGPVIGPVDLAVDAGEVLLVLGDSGAGKTTLLEGILGLGPLLRQGRCQLGGQDLVDDPRALRAARGKRMGYLPQGPWSSWHPSLSVGHQLADVVVAQRGQGRRAAWKTATELLTAVGCPVPQAVMVALPGELSGGLAQRAAIAAALAGEPELLVADEPTSALDTITRQAVGTTLLGLAAAGLALVIATHDVGLAIHSGGSVLVLYGGQIQERGPARDVLRRPSSPVTQELVAAWRKVHGDLGG